MLSASCDIRQEVERGRETIPAWFGQHPEILQVVVHIAYRCVENHVTKQGCDVHLRRCRVFAYRLRQIGIGLHVNAGPFEAQCSQAYHVQATVFWGDVEASHLEGSPASYLLK